jgi:hypothetical protein
MFFSIILLISFLLNNHIRSINQKINKLEYRLINHNINITEQIKILEEIEDLTIEKTIAIIREDLE